ncbi:MAG: hypothetical protein IMF09_03140 [Proteobacteria bacterium]|nr:hypothetical protein [Pseudomonadota bacterium]
MEKLRVKFFNRHISRLIYPSILLFLLLGFSLDSLAESIGCDDDFVQLDNAALVINVAPTNIDDTTNIQCALDVAASDGYPIVRLAADTYFVGSLVVENFKATLEGITKASTIIEVLDGSIDCEAMESVGLTSSVLKFVRGEPRIRFMTIKADHPCIGGLRVNNILHFTGLPATPANCANDVIFGAVDRVIIDATSWKGARIAVSASAEGSNLPGGSSLPACSETLLGTFKLNRSFIYNADTAIYTAMKAGAQVDINFNEFSDNRHSIRLRDTNQNTTITTNKFFNEDPSSEFGGAGFVAVFIETSSGDAPAVTRVVIHNNEFNMLSLFGEGGTVIWMGNDIGDTDISSAITNNRFKLSGNSVTGIFSKSVSNTHVSANQFSGDGRVAVFTNGDSSFATGWTITANTGLKEFTSWPAGVDIVLGTETSQCVVGPGQEAGVSDYGTENTVLP